MATQSIKTQPISRPAPTSVSRAWKRFLTFLFYVVLTAATLIWLTPVLAAVVTSLRTMDDITINGFWSWPREIVFSNFEHAFGRLRASQNICSTASSSRSRR